MSDQHSHQPAPPPGPQRLPLGYATPVSRGAHEDVSKAFPVQAAKYALYSGIIAFGINCVSNQGGGGMPAVGHLIIAAVCGLLILSGFVMGIVALVQNRGRQLPGVLGYAIAGICLNGIFILLNIILFTWLLNG